jgi:hypothetical protein
VKDEVSSQRVPTLEELKAQIIAVTANVTEGNLSSSGKRWAMDGMYAELHIELNVSSKHFSTCV